MDLYSSAKSTACNYLTRNPACLKKHRNREHKTGPKKIYARNVPNPYTLYPRHHCNMPDCKSKWPYTEGGLVRHRFSHHKLETVCFRQGCKETFTTSNTYYKHLASVHGVVRFACNEPQCNRGFAFLYGLKRHMVYDHHVVEEWFPCPAPLCCYTAKTKELLKGHKETVHNMGDKVCDFGGENCYRIVKYSDSQGNHKICHKCYLKVTGHRSRAERSMVQCLKALYDQPMIMTNSKVKGDACLNYRPDVMYAGDSRVVHVECDEKQHKGRAYTCDEKRMSDIYDEYVGKTVVWIRWNPDSYIPPRGTKQKSRSERLLSLVDTLKDLEQRVMETKMHIIYMFYNEDNTHITQNISHELMY